MRLCAIVKYPPIEGGVSAYSYWLCHALASVGHQVYVVTNADEVEPEYRMWFRAGDHGRLNVEYPGGGAVRVRSTRPWDAESYHHIPASNPMVTKLATLATEVVREHDCDLVFSFYLEPYGVAANLAAVWTGRPFVVRHAGSDRFALMSHSDLALAYKEVIRSAAAVVSAGCDLDGFGVAAAKVLSPPVLLAPGTFHPDAEPMDLNSLIAELAAAGCPDLINARQLRAGAPTIGVYGKAGLLKGSVALLKALDLLRARGRDFQLVMMGGGTLWSFVETALRESGVADRVWRLPFMAPWQVPGFIRACDAVCFLEHDFVIKQHGPRVAAEVLACGTPLVVSAEIVNKQPYRAAMRDGVNHFLVRNPEDLEELAGVLERVLDNPTRARAVGLAGTALVDRADERSVAEWYADALMSVVRPDGRAAARDPDAHRGELARFLRRVCPAAAELLGDGLPARLAASSSRSYDGSDSVLMDAYHIVEECVALAEAGSHPSADVIRAEGHLLWLAIDLEGVGGVAPFTGQVDPTIGAVGADGRDDRTRWPVANRYVRVDWLSVVIDQQAGDGSRGGGPVVRGMAGGKKRHYLFHKKPELGGCIYQIDALTARVLELSDGSRSIDQIAARVSGPHQSRVAVLPRLLNALSAKGIVGFSRYPRGERW
jgi:glycosyltransferase involved in cell wall biosynthesis